MRKDSKANVHHLTHSLKKIGRSEGRSRASIARQCKKDAKIKSSLIQLTVKAIKKEFKSMCALLTWIGLIELEESYRRIETTGYYFV